LPLFDRVVAAFTYEFPVTVLVQRLKYRGDLACARPLAAGLANALEKEPYPDLIIAMPLARARLASRGFNQSMEISRASLRTSTLRYPWISAGAPGRRAASPSAMETTRIQCP
jgi:predicted amidophosphoribosyltransferase